MNALYFEETPNQFVRYAGQNIDGQQHPGWQNYARLWMVEELAAIRLFIPEPADPIPEGKISTGQSVQRIDGEVKFVHTLVNKPQPTLAERREELMPRLGQRWDAAEKGGTSAMGWNVRTDAEGQAKITGGVVAFTNDPTLGTVPYEIQPGVWVDLDEPTMCALGVIVTQHVKACASRARAISEAIQSANSHAAMDDAEAAIGEGWPG
ncbi:protein of unknown function [Devosia crocina]|uniref:DUF4376 domain-containing protein n=1 Tax=Devosia crocina TaxID=429728 RepID=A0A1I7NEP4_9HYPH|nr:DUF4376 domain-containing protein [Devosia crocina]SFV33131.1 protein of unknown function [Devosia crocina]